MAEPAFDWCSFFALFWNDKGIKCRVNVPDTILFRYGQMSAWWGTQDGVVIRHASQATSVEAIRRRLLSVAQEEATDNSSHVAISRHGDGRPQLLKRQPFGQLCELLSDRLECGHSDAAPEIKTPSVLQAFIQPAQDLRYVTTLINDGRTIQVHTFQRKFSRRYSPMGSTAAGATDSSQDRDLLLGGGTAAAAKRAAEAEQQLGAVDLAIKMALRKATVYLVRYIQRAHGLTLGGIVCEYIRDVSGKVYLLSVLRTEWASSAGGSGGGAYSTALLTSKAVDTSHMYALSAPHGGGLMGMGTALSAGRVESEVSFSAALMAQGEDDEDEEEEDKGGGAVDDGEGAEGREPEEGESGGSAWRDGGEPSGGYIGEEEEYSELQGRASLSEGGEADTAAAGAGSAPSSPARRAVKASAPRRPDSAPMRSPNGGSPTHQQRQQQQQQQQSILPPTHHSRLHALAGLQQQQQLPAFSGARVGSPLTPTLQSPGGSGTTSDVTNGQRSSAGAPSSAGGAGGGHGAAASNGGAHPTSARPASACPAASSPTGFASGALGNGGGGVRTGVRTPGSPLGSGGPAAAIGALCGGARAAWTPSGPGLGAGAARAPGASASSLAAAWPSGHAGSRPSSPPPRSSVVWSAPPVGFGRGVPPPPLHPHLAAPTLSVPRPGSPERRSGLGSSYSSAVMVARPLSAAVSVLSATGAHVNSGARGAPLMMTSLAQEVEQLREELTQAYQTIDAQAERIRVLESDSAVGAGAFKSQASEMNAALAYARVAAQTTAAQRDEWRTRAEGVSGRSDSLEEENATLKQTINEERGTAMRALREYQDRESERADRDEQIRSEVLRLSDQLREEQTAGAALRRQLMQFSDIAERYQHNARDGHMEAGMEGVLSKIGHLFAEQDNPAGEQYATQKVLSHYTSDLRSVFLHYVQLDASAVKHWPPSMTFAQWMLYCKDSQTSDQRAGARIRSSQSALMVSPAECETAFYRYSQAAANDSAPSSPQRSRQQGPQPAHEQLLTYELFLSCLVHMASRTRQPSQPFISEALREYVLKYVARADRVCSGGAAKGAKGQLRAAVAGTQRGIAVASAMAADAGRLAPERPVSASARASTPPLARAKGSVARASPRRKASAATVRGHSARVTEEGQPLPLPFAQPDRSSSAISRELAMMGLEPPSGPQREPVRRGGGFDLI
ncbi:hypothetical protein FOA52_003375 [Chlamydomonas sp. UWO 241]|nr:hypothetical protein FOA52_003375 [Chlamydomonas sp. UWO 241]